MFIPETNFKLPETKSENNYFRVKLILLETEF